MSMHLTYPTKIFMALGSKEYMKSKTQFILNLLLIFLLLTNTAAASQLESNIVKILPGYTGTLPFKLETGYVSVGENGEHQLYYYFIESERNPDKDPLVFWLTGGPGCSGFSGLVYEIGPLAFDISSFDGSLPSLLLNPYSWTKIANIIFIDSPVGTGFSYENSSQIYTSSDTKLATDNYAFLRKWLMNHPTFIKNQLYVGGDSYGGKIVPMVALKIAEGNEAGLEPRIPLQGFLVGNSLTDGRKDLNERIPYAHQMALISDEYLELAESSCNGEYVNPDPNNFQCLYALRLIKECTNNIDKKHILEPTCKSASPKPDDIRWEQTILEDDFGNFLFMPTQEEPWCRSYNHVPSYVWANDEMVQEALHIRKGTIKGWTRCNKSLLYDYDVQSVVQYHQVLIEKGYQALAYSGDHDMIVPYTRTLNWIRELNLTIDDDWRPWLVDGQIAGYTEKYKKNQAYLTFATVKGAGHAAPEYKPKQCFAMASRWLSSYPL